jgi:hypothetical protein
VTDAEQTLLELMANGEDMLPIGAWKEPLLSLADRGYAEQVGNGYRVTAAGRAALDAAEDDAMRGMIGEHNARVRQHDSTVIEGDAVEIVEGLPCPRQ